MNVAEEIFIFAIVFATIVGFLSNKISQKLFIVCKYWYGIVVLLFMLFRVHFEVNLMISWFTLSVISLLVVAISNKILNNQPTKEMKS